MNAIGPVGLKFLSSFLAFSAVAAAAYAKTKERKKKRSWQIGPLHVELEDEDIETRCRVKTGLEVLFDERWKRLTGKRVGWITNHTGVLADLRHGVDVAHASGQVHVAAIYGPEHGFRGAAQAGASEGFHRDQRTGIPIYDIYRKSFKALADLFSKEKVEVLVIDLQDVGSRFYTYIWTMYDCLVAAASMENSPNVLVLDRPNPIDGQTVQGPVMSSEYESFVGRKPICMRHGMTIGELAEMFNREFVAEEAGGSAVLTIVRMRGWERRMGFADTGLPWIPPSPNLPTPQAALSYAGFCLYEGTNVSEGRGTTLPFQMIGAPWIDIDFSVALRDETTRGTIPGVLFREANFEPTFSKHCGSLCNGIQIYQHENSDPIRAALATLIVLQRMYSKFKWKQHGSSFWIDNLLGSEKVRKAIDSGANVDTLIASWQDELIWFNAMRSKYLLY